MQRRAAVGKLIKLFTNNGMKGGPKRVSRKANFEEGTARIKGFK